MDSGVRYLLLSSVSRAGNKTISLPHAKSGYLIF